MKINSTRSLSPLEAKVVLSLEWEERRWVDRAEIIHMFDGNERTADKIIRSLRDKKWIERVAPGRYLLIPAERGPEGIPDSNLLMIGSQLVTLYYFGYTTAAEHYGFTSQSWRTVWVITRKTITPRVIHDAIFRFVNLSERKFFGYGPTTVFGTTVNMSDPEKTVLDCLDKVENGGGVGEVARIIVRAASQIEWDKLADYALQMESVAVIQRLGYLAKRTEVKIPSEPLQKLRSRINSNTRSYLTSIARWGKKAKYDPEWQLLVNVPDREIFSEI